VVRKAADVVTRELDAARQEHRDTLRSADRVAVELRQALTAALTERAATQAALDDSESAGRQLAADNERVEQRVKAVETELLQARTTLTHTWRVPTRRQWSWMRCVRVSPQSAERERSHGALQQLQDQARDSRQHCSLSRRAQQSRRPLRLPPSPPETHQNGMRIRCPSVLLLTCFVVGVHGIVTKR